MSSATWTVCESCSRRRDAARHQLRHPPAWAIDQSILVQAERLGATLVVIRERGGDRLWAAPIATFWLHGIRIERGHGEQVALPLAFWRVQQSCEPQQLLLEAVL